MRRMHAFLEVGLGEVGHYQYSHVAFATQPTERHTGTTTATAMQARTTREMTMIQTKREPQPAEVAA